MQTSTKSLSLLLLTLLLSISSIPLTSARATSRNPRQLARAALTVSAARAREASTYVSRLSSSVTPKSSARSTAFQDCVAMMADSANRLRQSVGELMRLGRAGSPEFELCLSNVRTWVSAALTDQNMCLGSLAQAGAAGGRAAGGRAAAAVRKKVVEVSKVTSNALSLANKITA